MAVTPWFIQSNQLHGWAHAKINRICMDIIYTDHSGQAIWWEDIAYGLFNSDTNCEIHGRAGRAL